MTKKKTRIVIIISAIAITALFFWRKIAVAGAVVLLILSSLLAKPEINDDISKYEMLRSGPTAEENYQDKLGMDESIWPASISETMEVLDYKMVYHNPWDPQYLGYLVVRYPDAEYEKEVARLRSYPSTEYQGYYGVTGENDYELLAVNADSYYGFVYAMADTDHTIIYAEQLFCNGFMDLDYEKYMPSEYFLDGFAASYDDRQK